MRTSLLAAPLILALAAAALCCDVASADTVADSCKAIRSAVDVAFCVSQLRSVPRAASADRHGHLLMPADLAAASAASARDAVAKMARDDPDPTARDALQACGFLYGAFSMPALRLMRGYAAARRYNAAFSRIIVQARTGCDDALGSSAARTTMARANHEFDQLAIMTTMLLNTFS